MSSVLALAPQTPTKPFKLTKPRYPALLGKYLSVDLLLCVDILLIKTHVPSTPSWRNVSVNEYTVILQSWIY